MIGMGSALHGSNMAIRTKPVTLGAYNTIIKCDHSAQLEDTDGLDMPVRSCVPSCSSYRTDIMRATEGEHAGVYNPRQNVLIAAFPSSPVEHSIFIGVADVAIPPFAYGSDLKLLEDQQEASEQYADIKDLLCL